MLVSSRNNSYVAIKILIGKPTDLFRQNHLPEWTILKQVSSPPNPHCLQLLSDFVIPGKGSAGEHLCFVTQVLGGDVSKLDETCGPIFPLPLAKCILLHILRGIAHAHSCGIVHTDLHLSNIFFNTCMSTADLDKLLKSNPSCRHPPEESHDGMMQTAVSQPLPVPTLEEAMQRTFILADFGSGNSTAQPITTHITDEITAPDLRPPEIIIGSPWNEKVDIWTFGCLIFEIVTHRHFFKLEPLPELNLDPTTSQLHQMISYTEEDFSPEQLTAGQRSAQFFKADCEHYLTFWVPIPNFPIEWAIGCYHVIGEEEVVPMATLMRRCLHLDPANRASAAELLSDPWFEGVDPI
ncbi:kinase-like protein [Suillus subalutaceus]|uniref:kinase-like protein n=1 Tax=Suillus subalutaceus TaxID=48586 RepID=UPI001B8806C4|nr:kinase-like protein [Suillus subalutaceus]KAG1845083.1 kinase-like protein [Suillus subalutaceus]